MEYILLLVIFIQSVYIVFKLNKKPKELTLEEKEQIRREKIEAEWQKLFNYNETIATRGYRE